MFLSFEPTYTFRPDGHTAGFDRIGLIIYSIIRRKGQKGASEQERGGVKVVTGFQVGESGGGAGVGVVLMRGQQCPSGCYTQDMNGNTCISYPFVCCFHTLGREIFNAVGVTPKGWGRRGEEGGARSERTRIRSATL